MKERFGTKRGRPRKGMATGFSRDALPRREHRAKVGLAIAATEGNIKRAAANLLVTPRWLYYCLDDYKLWPLVNEVRRAAQRRKAQRATRLKLHKEHKLRWHTEEML